MRFWMPARLLVDVERTPCAVCTDVPNTGECQMAVLSLFLKLALNFPNILFDEISSASTNSRYSVGLFLLRFDPW